MVLQTSNTLNSVKSPEYLILLGKSSQDPPTARCHWRTGVLEFMEENTDSILISSFKIWSRVRLQGVGTSWLSKLMAVKIESTSKLEFLVLHVNWISMETCHNCIFLNLGLNSANYESLTWFVIFSFQISPLQYRCMKDLSWFLLYYSYNFCSEKIS